MENPLPAGERTTEDRGDTTDRQPDAPDDSEGVLQFLPVNQVNSVAESSRRRAYLSCDACRQRKTRCVPAVPDQRHPCRRCVADERTCQFRNSRSVGARRGLRGRVSVQPPARNEPWSGAGDEPESARTIRVATSSMSDESALDSRAFSMLDDPQFQADFRPPSEESPGERSAPGDVPVGRSVSSQPNPTARSRIIATRLHDTADALDLLTLAAAGVQSEAEGPEPRAEVGSNHPYATSLPYEAQAGTGGDTWPRPADEADWNRFVLVKKGVMTKFEIIEYLDFYFSVLWPMRPIVHAFYRNPAGYVLLVVDEPLLLTCLVTLASRYHVLSGQHGEIRSERIHWQAWRLLQKYLQSAIWGSLITRSLGAIVSMLLMIEWHSKSINNPLGLSDGDDYDYDLSSHPDPGRRGDENDPSTVATATSRQRFGMSTLLEKLNIVAPAYRSNKMSWMLLSNAIALAQESGCFDQVSRESQGAFSPYETFKHEWHQLISVFIYLADESLSLRLGVDTLSPSKSTEAVRARFSSSFASLLPNSVLWESYYDLTLEAKKARDLLQSIKRAGPTVAVSSILPDLEYIERGLGYWKHRYYSYAVTDDASLLRACIDLEYQYLAMYSFAPANYMSFNDTEVGERGEWSARRKRSEALFMLADRATSASREMLNTLINVLEPSNMLKYVPVRCWQFVVAANLHLLKTTLTTADSYDDVRLLRLSIAAIRSGSPDDTHMAMRYARFLEIMLNSSHPSRPGDDQPSLSRSGFGQAADIDGVGAPPGFMTSLNDFGVPDIDPTLGSIGDLVDWSDESFSILGAIGFLPNM